MKNISLPIILCVVTLQLCAQQSNDRNYIIKRDYKQSGANQDDVSKVITQVQYFDGLGRPIQTVTVGQSPSGQDFVEANEYDAVGRVSKKYLPYIAGGNGGYQANALSAAGTWYTTNSAGLQAGDLGRPFQESIYELSPLSRVSSQRAPGNKSANSNVKYKINTGSEVKRYDYDPAGNTIAFIGIYAPGTLMRAEFTDEQGNVTNEYTDMLGQMICRQIIASGQATLSTYYIYDDLGLLRAVLQPNYQDAPSLTDHAFTYDYDERARMITKNVPGGGKTEYVYDQYNRLALSRDPNQSARGVWGFTKYDALDRPVVTGEIASALSRTDWSIAVDANTQHHEDRSNGVTAGYTLDKTAPKNAAEANLLTILFYDDYAFSKAGNLSYTAAYYPSNNANVKGQTTGGRVRMIPGSGAAGSWLTNVIYYDSEYRPIQTTRELYDLGAGAIERVSTKYRYDLAPVTDEQKTEQLLTGNATNTHLATFTYDHADRLLSLKEKVTSGANVAEAFTLAQRYNALGQLKSKWFHSKDGTNYLRRTDYTHNIRGWLTDGMTVYKKDANGADLAYFGFNLAYVNGANYTNGNISQMQWLNKDDASFNKGLSFSYDGANRLLGSTGLYGYLETENNIAYDKNGNLKALNRSGAAVDNLAYGYAGNRLSTVTDGSGSNLGVKSGVSNYSYDANGNMTSDGNRAATLTYNYLNLPKTITIVGKTLSYDFDASGVKHKYVSDTLTLKYAENFEYRQVGAANSLYAVRLSEGQAVFRKNVLKFEYSLKDHLGNVRLVFDEKGQVLQKTDYYPFGLEINRDVPVGPQNVRNGVNRYLFNGQESQIGSGYLDYGARMYMPEMGRWGVVDGMAEKNHNLTGYSYAINNPVLFTDAFGLDTSNTNANVTVRKGDVILFDKHGPETQSVDEAVVRSSRAGNQSAGMTMILPGEFAPTFRPGPTPTTLPRALPLLIPVAYSWVDAYLKGPSAIEGIAQLLERIGVPSEVLRGAKNGIVFAGRTPPGNLIKLKNGQGWRDSEGNEWKLDKLHKDHWDVTNPKTGQKVKEIDFENNQIWPSGPKNKNKR